MRTNPMTRRLAVAGACAAALAGAGAVPASAAPAQHEVFDAAEHLTAEENYCSPWAATFHEVRSGSYTLVLPGGRGDEFHVNGAVNGFVELIPDDATRPTYSGTYREKVNSVVTQVTEDGDVARIAQYRLRSTLRGTDGSQLILRVYGKTTLNANGEAVVSRDVVSCE